MKIEFDRILDDTVALCCRLFELNIDLGKEASFDQKNRFYQGIPIALSVGK